jgi:lysophospholipase L1-like esterase
VPVTSPQPGFRNTIHQQFNDSWEVYSFNRSGLSHGYYPGLSGYVFESQQNAKTSFKSESVYGAFRRAELLYSSDFETRMKLTCDTLQSEIILPPAKEVSAFTIPIDSACTALSVQVENPEPSKIFGINFENGPGVYVDNYAFRGNSGLPLRQIPVSIFSRFNNLLNNKLIILHFGLNVFTPGVDDYNWYEMAMRGVISHIKAASPGVPILVISMPDRAALIDGEYATPAELPDFIRMQQRIAAQQQVAFFSLFDAMGGVNSMKNWVEGKTKLAGGDYTHPNGTGANRIAEMIFQFLLNGFDQYSLQTTQTQEKTPLLP